MAQDRKRLELLKDALMRAHEIVEEVASLDDATYAQLAALPKDRAIATLVCNFLREAADQAAGEEP